MRQRLRDGRSDVILYREDVPIAILSAAVARLDQNSMNARFEGPTRQLFDTIGPRMPVVQRAIFANLWATRGLVTRKLQQSPATNAMVQTTTAPPGFFQAIARQAR